MPRPRNPKCLRCAAQSVETALAKPCWKGQACHSKRSYYLKHPENKAKKRGRNRAERLKILEMPLFGQALPSEILMTFYRDRADGPIHALEFSVLDQGETVGRVEAIHLKGVPQSKLRGHIKNVLGVLKAQFGQALSVSQGRQPAKFCPLCLSEQGKQGGTLGGG
ncbi:MAG: hypothetical protein WA885_13855 [Phormidesmis sp.]